jgi:tagatose 6-phosphate kinase
VILCVAPSPAWDVTYRVPHLREHATNRVRSVAGRAGGKAVNAARVLHALGEEVAVVAPVGGPTGALFLDDLDRTGVPVVPVAAEVDLRRTVTVVSDASGDATVITEPAHLTDWPALLAAVEGMAAEASVVVAAGSLPEGAPVDAFGEIVGVAARHDAPVVVDTSGAALVTALAHAPALVKPNLAELREITHAPEPRDAVRRLAQDSGAAVAVTLGADGIVLAAAGETWHASGAPLRGNPTGAGDAALAAFARGLRTGASWPTTLIDAVALSGAAVLAPRAGEFAPDDHQQLAQRVVIENVQVLS